MSTPNPRSPLSKKQIPTLLGLSILVVALVAGLLMFGQGTGVFAPRATPETTPKKIKITNISDKAFTVSFYTAEATTGFIKYGESKSSLKTQASDDRDQLSGSVGEYNLHHITVRGLIPGVTYFYVLGTGSGNFDNQGEPFSITTATDPKTPPPASKTIYGSVTTAGGTPAAGAVVYVTINGVNDMSSLVRSSGSWAVSLSNARSADGQSYATIGDDDLLQIFVQGNELSQGVSFTTSVSDAQPVDDLTLGTDRVADASSKKIPPDVRNDQADPLDDQVEDKPAPTTQPTKKPIPTLSPEETMPEKPIEEEPAASGSAEALNDLIETPEEPIEESTQVSTASAVFNMEASSQDETIYTTASPKITGQAPPLTTITISVHSDGQIEQTVTSDENGQFEIDLEQLSAQLEPGEHTVTYSYIDPDTGQEVTESRTFVVEDMSQLLAQADTESSEGSPYGSGNPYPLGSPTTVPNLVPTTPVSSGSSEIDDSSSRSAVVSTESALPEAGSVGTTFALVIGGLFFMFTGTWSWWVATSLSEEKKA